MIKVLFVGCKLNGGNMYVDDLYHTLHTNYQIQITVSNTEFWSSEKEYDIVHIQWIEYVINSLTDKILDSYFERLKHWKNKSRIVVTRHNLRPHRAKNELDAKLYDAVYTYADAVIHLGNYSLEQYKSSYSFNNQIQAVIPHQMYENIPNEISQEEARKKLKIKHDAIVILTFGSFRNEKERNLLLNAFSEIKHIKTHKIILLANRWLYNIVPAKVFARRKPFHRILWEIRAFYYAHISQKMRLFSKLVSIQNIQLFFKAADIVFIQRVDSLNSGNVPLAFSFAKTVVGPNVGNIGELLRETANPVFNPLDNDFVVSALKFAIDLADSGKGYENLEYAKQNLSLNKIVTQHVELYKNLCSI